MTIIIVLFVYHIAIPAANVFDVVNIVPNGINESTKDPRRRMINDGQWTIAAGNSKRLIEYLQNNILYNCNCSSRTASGHIET